MDITLTFLFPHRIAFLWAMAAHQEVKDRQFGVVNIHRDSDKEDRDSKLPQVNADRGVNRVQKPA